MKRVYRSAAAALLCAALILPAFAAVADSPGGAEELARAVSLGLVPDGFEARAQQPVTRGEFCALTVAVYEGIIGEDTMARREFADTDDLNVQKLGGTGIVAGVGGNLFAPEGTMTREQAGVICWKLFDDLCCLPDGDESVYTYADGPAASPWARDAIAHSKVAGVMAVAEGGAFRPKETLSIGESAAVLLRLYDMITECSEHETTLLIEYTARLLRMINAARAEAGADPLAADPLLHAVALLRAVELHENFSHARPDGRGYATALEDFGLGHTVHGENLFGGWDKEGPDKALAFWMGEEHYVNNVLGRRFTEAGIGIHMDHDGYLYWVLFLLGPDQE